MSNQDMNEDQGRELVTETKDNHWLLKIIVGVLIVQLLSNGATTLHLNTVTSENTITIALNRAEQERINDSVAERFSRTPTRTEMTLMNELTKAEVRARKREDTYTKNSLDRVAGALFNMTAAIAKFEVMLDTKEDKK